jgi:hypothetical protein
MPKMGLVMEDGYTDVVQVDSEAEASKTLGGAVRTLSIDKQNGLYAIEGAAAAGYQINTIASRLYSLNTGTITQVFGPVLVFGLVDRYGNSTKGEPDDLPEITECFLMGLSAVDAILMGE